MIDLRPKHVREAEAKKLDEKQATEVKAQAIAPLMNSCVPPKTRMQEKMANKGRKLSPSELAEKRKEQKRERKVLLLSESFSPQQIDENIAKLESEYASVKARLDKHETPIKPRGTELLRCIKLLEDICLWEDVSYTQAAKAIRDAGAKKMSNERAQEVEAQRSEAAAPPKLRPVRTKAQEHAKEKKRINKVVAEANWHYD